MVLKIKFIILFLFQINLMAEEPSKAIVKASVDKYFTAGYFSFQNDTQIKSPGADYTNLTYTTSGLLFGYEEATNFKKFRLTTNVDLFYGNTDGKAESNSLYYFRKQLITYGGLSGVSFLFNFDKEKKYFLGPEINIFYMKTSWYIPTNQNGSWTIDNTAKIRSSILINGEYYYQKYLIYHKFGYPIGGKSFVWNIGLGIKL